MYTLLKCDNRSVHTGWGPSWHHCKRKRMDAQAKTSKKRSHRNSSTLMLSALDCFPYHLVHVPRGYDAEHPPRCERIQGNALLKHECTNDPILTVSRSGYCCLCVAHNVVS